MEMKWEEANTDVYEILLSLSDTKNSIYPVSSVMPTGNWAPVLLRRAASSLLETQVLSLLSGTSVAKENLLLGIVLLSLSRLK